MSLTAKKRHSITVSQSTWEILKKLRALHDKSISRIIEESVLKMLKEDGYNTTYFKIMASVPECDEEENAELTKALDSLKDEDIKIAEEYDLEDKTHE